MPKLYIVINHGKLTAAFTIPELAQEYANEKMLEEFKKGYVRTEYLHGNYKDVLKRLGLPIHDLLSKYSNEELLIIIHQFIGLNYVVREVDLFA